MPVSRREPFRRSGSFGPFLVVPGPAEFESGGALLAEPAVVFLSDTEYPSVLMIVPAKCSRTDWTTPIR
jgi:hypothetical protein